MIKILEKHVRKLFSYDPLNFKANESGSFYGEDLIFNLHGKT